MGPFGVGEILMIGAILVIVFSASRMGQLGNALGKFVYSFKKASKGDDFVDASAARKLERGQTDAQVVDGDVKKP
ncbi:MAG: twin-arginine translocase TatA/TatE family subunit [Myxococcaceae bacterium]|jgi:sec-independent protein translocase protein TatA|nr:twin-arginine translocase TatA/TatE family subunit [Myxococcaceae bacterium]